MRQLLSILCVVSFICIAYSGTPVIPRVTYSPDNPEVGQVVTFTIAAQGGFACLNPSYTLDPDANDAAVGRMSIPGTHAYNAAGTYTVDLDENCATEVDRLLLNAEWILQNSSGIVSSNKTIIVTAPTTSAIPTLREWGIIILGLLLLSFSIVMIKNQSFNKA